MWLYFTKLYISYTGKVSIEKCFQKKCMQKVLKRFTLILKAFYYDFVYIILQTYRHLKVDLLDSFLLHYIDPLIAFLPVLMVIK